MNIKVGNKRIISDDNQYILGDEHSYVNADGAEVTEVINRKYLTKFDNVLLRLLDEKLKKSESDTIKGLRTDLAWAMAEIKEISCRVK